MLVLRRGKNAAHLFCHRFILLDNSSSAAIFVVFVGADSITFVDVYFMRWRMGVLNQSGDGWLSSACRYGWVCR